MSRKVFGIGFWLPVRALSKRRAARGHNLLGVTPAIQKLRVRAKLDTAQFSQKIAYMVCISKLFKSLVFQGK